MDQTKIGRFIAECRKRLGMTQMELAERLNITDRAVSKWETGRAMPDTSIMLSLTRELGISVNDLLCGEVVTMENREEKSAELVLELARQKESSDKQLLGLEIIIGIFSIIILLGFSLLAALLDMPDWARVVIVVSSFAVSMVGIGFALKIEQCAGYYECAKCGHRHVPKYASVFWTMHFGRTRLLRCPECGRMSWNKKRLTKDSEE